MNTLKRSLWIVVVLLCAFILAVGCSGGNKDTANDPSGNSRPDPGQDSTKGGETPSDDGKEEPVEIQIMAPLLQEVPSLDNEYYTILQEMTNTKLDIIWVPDDDYNTRFDLVMASGDLPEVITIGDYTRATLLQGIQNGAFWDLTDILGDMSEYPNLRDGMTPGSWKYVNYDGRIMGIPRSRSMIDNGIIYRHDWLEELNLPIPTTVDEFYETMKRIAQEKNVIALLNDPLSSSSLWAGFGIIDPTYDEDGGLIRDFLTPQFSDLVRWYRNAYADGMMAIEYSALTNTDKFDLLTSGRAASFDYSMYRKFTWTKDIQNHTPEGRLEVLPPLMGPAGYAAQLDIGTRGAKYISSKVPEEKVRKILRYFDTTASEEVTHLAYYGKEGIHHEVIDGQPVLNELGREQIQVTALNPITPRFTQWGKVHSPTASAAENAALEEVAKLYGEHGKVNPFRWLYSETWLEVWPDYDNEFKSMVTRAVVGQISMEQFDQYVEGIRNDPRIRQAFQEYAADYAARAHLD